MDLFKTLALLLLLKAVNQLPQDLFYRLLIMTCIGGNHPLYLVPRCSFPAQLHSATTFFTVHTRVYDSFLGNSSNAVGI